MAVEKPTSTSPTPQTPGEATKPARPNDAVLAGIVAEYRPYDTLPAFGESFVVYQKDCAIRHNPYEDQTGPRSGVNAQAFDRGANAAILYRRATDHLDAVLGAPEWPEDAGAEAARPGWLERDCMVTDQHVSWPGFNTVSTALTMIARLRELLPGDKLTVERSEGASVPPIARTAGEA